MGFMDFFSSKTKTTSDTTRGVGGAGKPFVTGGINYLQEQMGAGQNFLMRLLSGEFIDPNSPLLQELRSSITAQVSEAFNKPGGPFAQVKQGAQQSGNFFSQGRQRATERTGDSFVRTLTEALANPTFNFLNQQLGMAGNAAMAPFNQIGTIGQLYGTERTNTTEKASASPFQALTGITGAVGGLLGGFGAGMGALQAAGTGGSYTDFLKGAFPSK